MPTRSRRLLVAVAAVLAGSATAGAQDTTTARFPEVEGRALSGTRLVLPHDLRGARRVVIVAFQQWQQREVDSWMPALRARRDAGADLGVYEIPALGRGWLPLRGWIDGGMARGISDRGVRETTVTVYLDKGPFKRALGIVSERHAQLLVLGPDGAVVHRAIGAATPEGLAALERVLATSP